MGVGGRAILSVAGACLLLQACRSSGPEAALSAGPGPTTTTVPLPTIEEDRAAAQRVVLTQADVPRLPLSRPTNHAEAYRECGKSQLLPTGGDPRQARPAGFLKDETAELRRLQTTGVASWAVLAPTEAEARAVMDLLRRPDYATCLEGRLSASVDGFTGLPVVQSASTTPLKLAPLGDDAVAFRTRLIQRGNVDFDFELTAIRRGRGLAYLLTGRLGNVPFEDSERLRLATTIASRMG